MSLASRLRELRAEKQASLQAVADAVGATKPHIWELEKGKSKNPSFELLKNLASFYSVSLDDLAGIDDRSANDMRYNALLRKLDPENMSDADWKVVEQAINFAVNVIEGQKGDQASS